MHKVVFVVIIEEIMNNEMYMNYVSQVPNIIQTYNGEYIARSNNILEFIGDKPERAIIITFNSIEEAKSCLYSEEYKKIKHLRENSTRSRAFFIQNE